MNIDEARRLYVSAGQTHEQIAETLDVTVYAVRRAFRAHGITRAMRGADRHEVQEQPPKRRSKADSLDDAQLRRALAARAAGATTSDIRRRFGITWYALEAEAKTRGLM